jgi:UDP-N-acetylmuramyl pentapeptide phosphotransferase/UDP-N-acetylglucosamine-1-phosphate transferase
MSLVSFTGPMPPLIWDLAAFVSSFLIAVIVIPWVRAWAERRGVLDVPVGRSAHVQPRPRLGGVGLVAAVIASALMASVAGLSSLTHLQLITAVSLMVAAVSLVDDLRGLPALPRLAVHLVAGALTVFVFTATPGALVGPDWTTYGLIGAMIVVFWIASFINAFNFMDGVDGIAGAQALTAGLAWMVIGWIAGEPVFSWSGGVIAGASLGFLRYNWQPASIFLGDVGATFLGYWLAAMPLLSARPSRFVVPSMLIVWPFAVDVAVTLVKRIARGEHLFAGHQQHLYQRLAANGWSHAQVARIYAGLSVLGSAAAVGLVLESGLLTGVAVAAMVAAWIIVSQRVTRTARRSASASRVPHVQSNVQVER